MQLDSTKTPLLETALGPMRTMFNSLAGTWIRGRFNKIISGFQIGKLRVEWPDGSITECGHACSSDELAGFGTEDNPVVVCLESFDPIRRMALQGSIGWGEAYMAGTWSTNSIIGLFLMFLKNKNNFPTTVNGSRMSKLTNVITHRGNKNTLDGSKRNIASHYDLGNEFYELWLDESMSYSSACYEHPDESLSSAQQNKINKVLSAVDPVNKSNILEIGCGWGSMACALAKNTRCDVKGVSLSREQLAYARDMASKNMSAGHISFEFRDYRQIEGKYDHVVSIEMFEAVGQEYWTDYFSKLRSVLKRGGSAVLQVITISEDRFDDYSRNPDFIQKYIFPGGMLPTKSLLAELAETHGFQISDTDFFGASYAKTLRDWRERFDKSLVDIKEQGFDDRFSRMWRYYLAYCEAGFTTGSTDVGIWKIVRQ